MSDATTDQAVPGRPAVEKHEFSAEVGRLLDLVVHSLYSEREIFLRELVANAADATDRRRFEALTQPALGAPGGARVGIIPDKAARTITIADDGIGMSKGNWPPTSAPSPGPAPACSGPRPPRPSRTRRWT